MGREEQPHVSALFECARSPEISQRFPLRNSFSNSHPSRTVVLPWPGSVMVPGCDEEGAGTLPTRLKDPTKLRPRGRRVHPSLQWSRKEVHMRFSPAQSLLPHLTTSSHAPNASSGGRAGASGAMIHARTIAVRAIPRVKRLTCCTVADPLRLCTALLPARRRTPPHGRRSRAACVA